MSDPHEEYADEIAAELKRVERRMTAAEIFEAGYKLGLSHAGIRSDAEYALKDWLLARAENISGRF